MLTIFPTSNCMNLDFYVTLLDSSCSLVLEYNWLIQHNPLNDWINELINFCLSLQENLALSHIAANTSLASLSAPLCNHQIPQFPYLHLRSLCLPLSNLISLSLVLWHSYEYQNFWALATLNFVFVFQIFRLTLQNLQKLLVFPMFLPSITNLPIFSAKPKLKSLLLIVLITFKSI